MEGTCLSKLKLHIEIRYTSLLVSFSYPDLVLAFHLYMGPGGQTQVFRLTLSGGRYLYLFSHLASSLFERRFCFVCQGSFELTAIPLTQSPMTGIINVQHHTLL